MDLGIGYRWVGAAGLPAKNFRCGHCGSDVAPAAGWIADSPLVGGIRAFIYLCHRCSRPNFFDSDGRQAPGPMPGHPVEGIVDKQLQGIYGEARRAFAAGCYTASVLCCRKLLMHICVEKKAPQGLSFAQYVEYLDKNHYIPPDGHDWVDHIRQKSNEANHEIVLMSTEDASELLNFSEMLLTFIYEFPARVAQKKTQK